MASASDNPSINVLPIPFPLAGSQLRRSDRDGNGARGTRAAVVAARLRKPICPNPPRPTAPEEGASAARWYLQQPVSVGESTAVRRLQRLAASWPNGGHWSKVVSINICVTIGAHVATQGATSAIQSPGIIVLPIPFPLSGFQLRRSERDGNGARGTRAAAEAARLRKPICPIPPRPTAPEEGASAARYNLQQPVSVGDGTTVHGLQRLAAGWPNGGHW